MTTTEINGLPLPPLGYRYAKPGDKRCEGLKFLANGAWDETTTVGELNDRIIYCVPLNDGYEAGALPWGEQIAEGHNNPKLTNALVGEGYRLLELGDKIPNNAEVYASGVGPWKNPINYSGWVSCTNAPFRVPITKPKKTVPLEAEDWRGIWWVREGHIFRLVTAVTPFRIWASNLCYSHKVMADSGYERSQDQITWTPCSKEVDA